MLWLKHERTGFSAPINAVVLTPGGNVPPGNIVVDLIAGTYRVVSAAERKALPPGTLRLNHFVTCTDRLRYRGRSS